MAQKYYRDARQRMESLIMYVIYKKPPMAASVDPLSVNSTIN
jgi:hypothetical protein